MPVNDDWPLRSSNVHLVRQVQRSPQECCWSSRRSRACVPRLRSLGRCVEQLVPSCKTTSHVVQRAVVGCSARGIEISCWPVVCSKTRDRIALATNGLWPGLQSPDYSPVRHQHGSKSCQESVQARTVAVLTHGDQVVLLIQEHYTTTTRTTRPTLDGREGA